VISVRDVAPVKVLLGIAKVDPQLTTNETSEIHWLKALSPIEITLTGTIKAVNAEASKELVPIVLSALPVSTDTVVRDKQL
jgi:hypothetical protein